MVNRTQNERDYIITTGNGSIEYLNTLWDDARFPSTSVRRGALSKPDFDYANNGLLFPQNDPSEKIHITDQTSHGRLAGSDIRLHVHFIQTSALVPVFQIDYRWYNNGEVVPSFTTIETSGTGIFSYSSGSMLQITSFPAIDGTGKTLSSFYDFIFYRKNLDGVSGDILVKGIDFHYEIDRPGSRDEYIK